MPLRKVYIRRQSNNVMGDKEELTDKLEEIKEAIEGISFLDPSQQGLIINESLTNQFTRLERQLSEMNRNLSSIHAALLNLSYKLK